MENNQLKNLGPLGVLAGIWEGTKGDDLAPSDDRGTENNKYRERFMFEPINAVQNHEQSLFGLRYLRNAWRLNESVPFHEDLGYYLWDPGAGQLMRCFVVPRGVATIAGGSVEPSSRIFKLTAECGATGYGVCSNLFLDREFRTVRFEMTVTIHDDNSFSYTEDTQLQIPGQKEIFHHRDSNTLTRVSA